MRVVLNKHLSPHYFKSIIMLSCQMYMYLMNQRGADAALIGETGQEKQGMTFLCSCTLLAITLW